MRDRVLTYAIAISIVAHLGAAVVIGRTSAARLSAAPPALAPRYIKVDLIDLAAKHAPKPSEAPRVSLPKPLPPPPPSGPAPDHPNYAATPNPAPTAPVHTGSPRLTAPAYVAGNPGGKLNIGSTSPGGDLPGNWGGGKTPPGWVPGPDEGVGKGPGRNPGEGTPDPPKHANDNPAPPPQPAMVSVRICSDSGLLPGPNCKQMRTEQFVEGKQPGRTCEKCQPDHKSRLADRAEPQLTRDSRPSVPSSIPEGLTLRVEIRYTVTADGDVTGVEVINSSGYKALDRAVVRSASQLKYKPAVQDGVARSVKRTRAYTINT